MNPLINVLEKTVSCNIHIFCYTEIVYGYTTLIKYDKINNSVLYSKFPLIHTLREICYN